MNKADLVEVVAKDAEITKVAAARAVDATIAAIMEGARTPDGVRIVGFGTFSTKRRDAREGRNPHTGEKIQIAASTAPKFVPGKEFKTRISAG